MVTSTAAHIAGLPGQLGTLATGRPADPLVCGCWWANDPEPFVLDVDSGVIQPVVRLPA